MKKLFNFIILLLLVFPSLSYPQNNDPNEIIKNLKSEFEQVKDYQVKVKIKVKASMLKMPEMNAQFFFKQPDKTKVKSESFAMIPKQGVNVSPVSYLKGEFTAVFARNETVDGRELAVIKIIPLKEDNDVLLTTVWVDKTRNVVRKLKSSTKGSGTINVDFNYDENMDFPLPSKITFSFNLDEKGLPKDTDKKTKKRRRRDYVSGIKGKVILTYSDYKVNTNLPDSLFEKKKEDK